MWLVETGDRAARVQRRRGPPPYLGELIFSFRIFKNLKPPPPARGPFSYTLTLGLLKVSALNSLNIGELSGWGFSPRWLSPIQRGKSPSRTRSAMASETRQDGSGGFGVCRGKMLTVTLRRLQRVRSGSANRFVWWNTQTLCTFGQRGCSQRTTPPRISSLLPWHTSVTGTGYIVDYAR